MNNESMLLIPSIHTVSIHFDLENVMNKVESSNWICVRTKKVAQKFWVLNMKPYQICEQ